VFDRAVGLAPLGLDPLPRVPQQLEVHERDADWVHEQHGRRVRAVPKVSSRAALEREVGAQVLVVGAVVEADAAERLHEPRADAGEHGKREQQQRRARVARKRDALGGPRRGDEHQQQRRQRDGHQRRRDESVVQRHAVDALDVDDVKDVEDEEVEPLKHGLHDGRPPDVEHVAELQRDLVEADD
jgi:hypothetical protein